MKNVKELNLNELVTIDGGVYPGEDGKGCTEQNNPFDLLRPPYGDPSDWDVYTLI